MVQCSMWRTDGEELKGEQIIARTVVEIERRSFIWDIKYLTSKQIFEKNSLSVTLPSKKGVLILSPLLKEGIEYVDEKFSVKITSADESIKYFTFHCDLLDSLGNKLDCGEKEFWFSKLKQGAIFKLPYTPETLIEDRGKYLPKNVLSLQCDCVISTGIAYERIESFITGIDGDICKHNYEKYECNISPDLKADLKSIAMFSTDMKERTKECVDITDLDSETVRRLLLYVYTDALEEDLQCQSACQLYAAADKYDVLSLKNRCSSILVSIIDHKNACDILSMADRHQDEELKKVVQKYILQNDDVFRSNEWRLLMKSNPILVSETMYLTLQ
ncbi:TD and POZ domain-containing protein 5 [Caerostris extrusa]|uniref:TD and POZ domain-containing protein 5 n=1 Tax=Caerostris extrusa TaxID=172846 RepID=A0AAV4RP16_CAEEX|nr:TD and POZ domain-containing protein 5 [Caerostris extrusa]